MNSSDGLVGSQPLLMHTAAKGVSLFADEKLSAFVELEREVLTVTFYLASRHADSYQ
jgi:hypothetical protein